MNILFLSPFNMEKGMAQSGTIISIKNALIDAGHNVYVIDNLKINKLSKLLGKIVQKITYKNYDLLRNPRVLKNMAKEINRRKVEFEYDIIFSSTSVLCAYLEDEKPIVFYTDATYGGMLNYYWDPKKIVSHNMRDAFLVEKLSLINAQKAIYASKWAVDSAIELHGAIPEKCIAINRGANISHLLSRKEIFEYIDSRVVVKGGEYYRLLFVGREWTRKGGEFGLRIVRELNKRGYNCKFVVVGCKPLLSEEDKKFVELIGFLNKKDQDENIKLQKLFLESDFYLQPSRQECQGIAYAEASAFGLPVIATDTGGVSDIVTSKNGVLLKSENDAADYANVIISMIDDKETYKKLAYSTYDFFQESLNWKSVGKKLTETLEELI